MKQKFYKMHRKERIYKYYVLDHDRPLLTVELEVDLSETSLIYLYEKKILISK
jgi:hypothetical protein